MEKTLLGVKHYSRYALISLVLNTCKEPKTKADLYWTRPKQYSYKLLDQLIGRCVKLGLLAETDEKYHTTLKGTEYMYRFETLLKFLEESELTLKQAEEVGKNEKKW